MKILFVYTSLPKGGIETFLVRMTEKLFEKGYSINFLFFSNNIDVELLNELKKYANVFTINDYLYFSKYTKNFSPIIKLLIPLEKRELWLDVLKEVEHIHAPDYNSILYVNKILNKADKINVHISTGVYHINEFNFIKYKKWYFGKKIIQFLNCIPQQNILFFNEVSNSFYNNLFQNKFKKSIITPIGIDLSKYNDSVSALQNNRVVSVGRLTNWKKYNFHMIEVINSLKKKNIFIKYDSYGDGEQLLSLNEKVNNLNLSDLITFHPAISYNKFKSTISDSLMFIGAGTALIEASACGIPALIGIENEEYPLTYGFLHDTKTYSYQEQQLSFEKYKIEDFILKLKNQNEESYREECVKAQGRANDFSIEITIEDFIKMTNNSRSYDFSLNKLQLILVTVSMFLNKIICPKTNYSKRL